VTSETCPNCDTPLNGQYCSNYGQRQGRYDQVFTQLIGEALGDLFRPDARVTKTLFKYVILATVYFSLCLMALLANFIWQVTAL